MKQSARPWLRRFMLASSLVTSIFALTTFVSGCESEVNSYCVARCNCQGCSERERADCLDDVEDAQRLAEHDGCATQLSSYLACYVGEGSCNSGAWAASSCLDEGTAMRTCSSRAATFIKSACEEEQDKRAACGLGGGGSESCFGAEECAALCALGASCNDLESTPPDSTYSLCVVDCSSTSSSSSTGSSGGP
ncbi:MAG TPA: hypothetical protein PK156_31615 [Polyangium sp.]|nr:hypothetical protein [Polyangium sp.]